jgi:uncharacterized protein
MTMKRRLATSVALFAGVAAIVLPASPAPAVSTTVVISEFATRGPGGGSDEFVEIQNISSDPVEIGGWDLSASNSAGTASVRATVPFGVVLAPGQHYLFANTGASLAVTPDQTYGLGIADDGGIAFGAQSIVVDSVGMSAGSAFGEGTPLTPLTLNIADSYQRQVSGYQDTDDNSTDFFNGSSPTPENAASDPTPDPGATTTTVPDDTTTTEPPADVPEFPWAGVLPLFAGGMLGTGIVVQSRRRRRQA